MTGGGNSRKRLFAQEIAPIRGLASLSQPGDGERVSAVVDVAVLGARADGKTQFIAHAVRTLRAYAPTDLSEEESRFNQDILQVVMNARDPRPDATAPGHVKHYTFRARPEMLLRSLGAFGRLGAFFSQRAARLLVLLATVNAIAIWALALYWRNGLDIAGGVVAGSTLVVGVWAATRLARGIFLRSGDVEIVFWDVAGEEVYGKSASGYYTFLSELAQRRARRQPAGRRYGFAPVLICNPLAVATDRGNSAFARLRELMPLFAALANPAAEVLVAVNRWSLVKRLCRAGKRAGDRVAIVPEALGDDGESSDDDDASEGGALDPLPVLRRRVVRDQCIDIEEEDFGDTSLRCIHYEAGLHAELEEGEWDGFDQLPASVRRRFAPPKSKSVDAVLTYRYAEGPGAFSGEARDGFIRWLLG
ncbi:MAG: hypothetical protein KJO07_14650, partial [Deltaproteobacteria bacterium]|nr:hypothetical protein [Deltaproteobacteria bacterium]